MARILIHTLLFPPDGVSTAYLMGELAAELAGHGHDVSVLTTTPHYNVEPRAIESQPLTKVRSWLYESRLGKVHAWHVAMPMKRGGIVNRGLGFIRFHLLSLFVGLRYVGRADVVFAPSPPPTIGVVAWLIARLKGARSIYNVQEVYPDFAIHQGLIRNRLFIAGLRLLERAVYRLNDRIVVISPGLLRIVESRMPSIHKAVMIPNFIDTDFQRPLSRHNEFSREHGFDNRFVILYAGNIGLSQDWDLILRAAEDLKSKGAYFVVVGGGARAADLRERMAVTRSTNIEWLDYQPREKVPAMYASCDLAVIPMKPHASVDTFPSKLLTIMASERAVVVAAETNTDLAQLVADAQCGWVVPPERPDAFVAAIQEAMMKPEERFARAAAGLAHVRAYYSRRGVAAQYDRLVRTLTD